MVELAYALSGNRAGAEDIAQEAFLRPHRDWHRVGRYQHRAPGCAGPDGHLYVSEHGYGGDPTAGRILRINPR